MLQSIQFMRFAAALAVVIYHAFIFVMRESDAAFPTWAWSVVRSGAGGVHVFFVISGLVMAYTTRREFAVPGASARFMVRRAIRIYPIYWVAMLLFMLVLAPPGMLEIDWANVPLTAMLIPGHAPAIIEPAWTLAFEMYFYIVFAALLALPRRLGLALLAGYFLASILWGLALGPSSPLLETVTSVLLLEFLAGVLIALAIEKERLVEFALKWIRPGALVLAGMGLMIATPFLSARDIPEIAFSLPGSFLIVCGAILAEASGRVSPRITRLSWLGESSYALYLIHVLPIALMVGLLGPTATLPGTLALGGALTILSLACGFALHLYVERPMLHALRARFAKRRPS